MPRVIINLDVELQKRILKRIGYNQPTIPKGRNRTIADIRLKPFKNYQEKFPRSLKSPLDVDEGKAKGAASPDRYPIFEDGRVARYEDTVGEVVTHVGDALTAIIDIGDMNDEQAASVRAEFRNFRALAKQSFDTSIRADLLAREAAILCDEAGIPSIPVEAESTNNRKPAPPRPPRERPARPAPREEEGAPTPPVTPLVQAQTRFGRIRCKGAVGEGKSKGSPPSRRRSGPAVPGNAGQLGKVAKNGGRC